MKTDIDIKDELYSFIKRSRLASEVTGEICKTGIRPKDSDKEDIVISVVSSDFTDVQNAVLNVNVYVQDEYDGEQFQEATIRLRTLCRMCSEVLERGHGDDYLFWLTSQRIIAVSDAKVHVINNKLLYKHLNE